MERVVVASLLVLLWGLNLFGQEGNMSDWKTFDKVLKVADEVGQLPKHFARCTTTKKVLCIDADRQNGVYRLGGSRRARAFTDCRTGEGWSAECQGQGEAPGKATEEARPSESTSPPCLRPLLARHRQDAGGWLGDCPSGRSGPFQKPSPLGPRTPPVTY